MKTLNYKNLKDLSSILKSGRYTLKGYPIHYLTEDTELVYVSNGYRAIAGDLECWNGVVLRDEYGTPYILNWIQDNKSEVPKENSVNRITILSNKMEEDCRIIEISAIGAGNDDISLEFDDNMLNVTINGYGGIKKGAIRIDDSFRIQDIKAKVNNGLLTLMFYKEKKKKRVIKVTE